MPTYFLLTQLEKIKQLLEEFEIARPVPHWIVAAGHPKGALIFHESTMVLPVVDPDADYQRALDEAKNRGDLQACLDISASKYPFTKHWPVRFVGVVRPSGLDRKEVQSS